MCLVLQRSGAPLNISLNCWLSPHLLDWSTSCILPGVSEFNYCWEDPSLVADATTTMAPLFQEQSYRVTFLQPPKGTFPTVPALGSIIFLLIPLIVLFVSPFLSDFLVQMVLDNHFTLDYLIGPARRCMCHKGHHLLHIYDWFWTNSDNPTSINIPQSHPSYQIPTLTLSKGFDLFSWLDSNKWREWFVRISNCGLFNDMIDWHLRFAHVFHMLEEQPC